MKLGHFQLAKSRDRIRARPCKNGLFYTSRLTQSTHITTTRLDNTLNTEE